MPRVSLKAFGLEDTKKYPRNQQEEPIAIATIGSPEQAAIWNEQIKYLSGIASDLSDSDLKWSIIIEDSLKKYGNLTPKLSSILKHIYERN
jgi:hypothetical protein